MKWYSVTSISICYLARILYMICSSRSEKAYWHENCPLVRMYFQDAVLNVAHQQFYPQCRINLKKTIQPQSTTKLLTGYRWKCKTLLWQTDFTPYTLAFAPPLSPPPPHNVFLFTLILDRWTTKRGLFSISWRKTSRKVAAWKSSVKEYCFVRCNFILPCICFIIGHRLRQHEVNYSSLSLPKDR